MPRSVRRGRRFAYAVRAVRAVLAVPATVARLRHVSEKAEAFEAEVRVLIARAEAAKATASFP